MAGDDVDGALAEKRDPEKSQEELTVVGPAIEDDPLATPPAESAPQLEYVPDGGREAWTVVLGSALALFSSGGMINTYVSSIFRTFFPICCVRSGCCL